MSWSSFDRPTDGEAVLFLPELVIDARSSGYLRCDRLVDIASWILPDFQIPARRQDRPRSSGVAASQLLMAGATSWRRDPDVLQTPAI
jgi:hypothetical protein